MLAPPPSLTPARLPLPGAFAPFSHLMDGSPLGGGAAVAWDDAGLEIVLEASGPAEPARLGLLLDPVGDGEAFFEIAREGGGRVAQSVFRRSPGGYRRDGRWQWDGLDWGTTPAGRLRLAGPFRGLGATLPHEEWRANFFSLAPGHPPAAWAPTGWNTLYQPGRFGFLRFRPGSG